MKKRNYLSILSLLFAALPLTSQTQAQYGISGRYPYEISDMTLLEEKVLPVSLREQIEKNRNQATPEELPASPLVLDKSRAVGTTIGTADVTPSGAATYQIPIEVPQGIAGLEPAVSVAYNSQAGNGLLGYGWYMSAFSAISRCGKTYYYDNAAEAPQLSNSDNLLLDNQRLLLVSGQNLVNGAKYRLEYDPTTEIAFKTVNSNSYFVVRTKEGITREFGSTADSHIEATGGNTLCWLLAKTTDQSGNTITYQYEEIPGNGEFYLTKIQYAGNRSIRFAYETRSDKQTTYFAGFPINNNKILKSLSTYIGQIQVKQYQFSYEKNGLYTQLTEVVEKGQNNEHYNSIKVNYGRGGVMPQEYISTLPEKREGSRPLFADFNGDGKTDFLSYPEKSSYTTSDVATLFVATQVFGDVNFSKQCTIPLQSSYATFQGLLLADLNGDGCMDVVNISKAADGTYRYNYYFFDGDKLTYTFKGFNTNGNEAFTGDFNGDGKYEILVKNNQKVFDGEGKEIASGGIDNWGSEFFQNYYPNNRYLCDFNGNGKTDLLVMDGESGWVYELNSAYENSYVAQGGKRITPYIRQQTETDHLKGTTKTIECTATDTWGNPLTLVTRYGNDVTETLTSTYFNSETDNLWRIGLPLSKQKKTTRGSDNWIEKQTYTYNTRYLPEQRINYTSDGTKKVSEETFAYDSRGNIVTESVRTYASATLLTTRHEYSADGVFKTKTTDPMSLATTWTYNTLGQVVSSKDPLNNTTTYGYDGMGRLIRTTYPDQVSSTTTFTWESDVPNSVYAITETTTGKPAVKTYYDAFDRELRKSIVRFDGSSMNSDKKYDNAGRIAQASFPFKGNAASQWNTYTYDGYGRLVQLAYASGNTETYAYSGTSVTTSKDGIVSTRKYNTKGELVSVTDPAGTIVYTLRADGQPSRITAPGDVTTSFEYDEYGRRKTIVDPSAGRKTFTYDAAGYPKEEIDANNRKKVTTYDPYGRITSRQFPEFTTTYTYNSNGQLTAETSTNGTACTYQYDSYGRLAKERDNAPDNKWLETTYSYASGNVASVGFTSQSGNIATEYYTYSNGHTSEIKVGTTSVWKINAENATGSPTSVTTGAVTRSYTYDEYGIPTGRSASSASKGTFMNHTYRFDRTKNNLSARKDNVRNLEEIFAYDNLNRLTRFASSTVEYDVKGNITRKSDVGNVFSYATPGKPYAVSRINAAKNTAIPPRNQAIAYTSFERPSSLSENGYEAVFTYNGSGDRKKMQLKNNGTNQSQRYYLGGRYEAEYAGSSSKQILYLGGDAYTAPAVYINQGNSWYLYFICRDYLGSITHVVNTNGTVIEENSYDAWGRLRNPATQTAYLPDEEPSLFTGRGYTGHEHLPHFGLIQMNARLYDPATGRFLSPDPFVQIPDFSQNFNRYTYSLNNPLSYTDPNGEFFFSALIPGIGVFLDAMLIGTVVGAVGGGVKSVLQGHNFFNGMWKGAITGAIGGLMAPIGGAGMSFGLNVGLGVAQGAVVGSIDAALWGGNIAKGILWGGISGGSFAALTSDNMTNLIRGKGFKTNESVFKDFSAGKYTKEGGAWQQDVLDYFGFEGEYVENIQGPKYISGNEAGAIGATNIETGNIIYGPVAFDSYDNLKATYYKEMFHRNRYLTGKNPLTQNVSDLPTKDIYYKYYPEEKIGFIHQYKNHGLYPHSSIRSFDMIRFYELGTFDLTNYYTKKWSHFIYNIPRRW